MVICIHVHRVRRNSPPAILLAFREGKRIRKRTLANLSKWPPRLIDRVLLKGGVAVADPAEAFEILVLYLTVMSTPPWGVSTAWACPGSSTPAALESETWWWL